MNWSLRQYLLSLLVIINAPCYSNRNNKKDKKTTNMNSAAFTSENTDEYDTQVMLKGNDRRVAEEIKYSDADKEKQMLRRNASEESLEVIEIANMIRDTVI
jgi:hypothetical protein